MNRVCLRPCGQNYDLAIRADDRSGGGYERIALVDKDAARAIAGPHTNIVLQGDGLGQIAPEPVMIVRCADRKPGQRAWHLRVGDRLVGRVDPRDQQHKPIFLSDDHVRALAQYSRIGFEPGEPDWQRRDAEILEDEAYQLEARAAELRRKAALIRRDGDAKEVEDAPSLSM